MANTETSRNHLKRCSFWVFRVPAVSGPLVAALLVAACGEAHSPAVEELVVPAPVSAGGEVALGVPKAIEPPPGEQPILSPLTPQRAPAPEAETPTAVEPRPPPQRVAPTEVAPQEQDPVEVVAGGEGEPPPEGLAKEILDTYTAFWDSYWAAAVHPVNPDHPGIARYSTEPLRSRTLGVLLGRVANGVALRLPEDHGAGRVVVIKGWDATSAEVLDCFVDTAVLYETSTGRIRNDEQATVVHLALLRREGARWRVAEIFEQAIHTERTGGCIVTAPTDPSGQTDPLTPSQVGPPDADAAHEPLLPS